MLVCQNDRHTKLDISYYINSSNIILVIRTLRKPKPKIVPKLKQRYSGIRHYLFEKRYHPFVGIIVGLIALLAWPMSYSTGREDGLGITTPSHILFNS